jgi:NADP-dependent 3-hydroxy acid dehydrogenase YdfG
MSLLPLIGEPHPRYLSPMQRVWFITGASSGFGRALAEAALKRGDSAVIAARRTDGLDLLAAAHAQSALAIGLDVTDAEAR